MTNPYFVFRRRLDAHGIFRIEQVTNTGTVDPQEALEDAEVLQAGAKALGYPYSSWAFFAGRRDEVGTVHKVVSVEEIREVSFDDGFGHIA